MQRKRPTIDPINKSKCPRRVCQIRNTSPSRYVIQSQNSSDHKLINYSCLVHHNLHPLYSILFLLASLWFSVSVGPKVLTYISSDWCWASHETYICLSGDVCVCVFVWVKRFERAFQDKIKKKNTPLVPAWSSLGRELYIYSASTVYLPLGPITHRRHDP